MGLSQAANAGQGFWPGVSLYTTSQFTGNETIPFDTQLPNGENPQTAKATTSVLSSIFSGGLPINTGGFYGIPLGATLEAFLTVTGTLYAYPIYLNNPNALALASLSLSVTTGQTGGAAHIGIYADNGAGYPGNLIYDSGVVSGLTSTTVVTDTITSGPVLNSGIYWIATIFTASGTYPSVAAIKTLYTGVVGNQIGYDTAAHALATSGQAVTGYSVATTYGALPLTFTASATRTLNADTPAVALGF